MESIWAQSSKLAASIHGQIPEEARGSLLEEVCSGHCALVKAFSKREVLQQLYPFPECIFIPFHFSLSCLFSEYLSVGA